MSNNSIFSGLTAYSGREIASELGVWSHGESSDFGMLIGAVMSLALTVEQHNRRLGAIEERLGPAVRQSVNAHNLSPAAVDALREQRAGGPVQVPAASATIIQEQAGQLALVYAGLRELRNLLDNGRMQAQTVDALDGVLIAGINRLSAMLEAGEQAIQGERRHE